MTAARRTSLPIAFGALGLLLIAHGVDAQEVTRVRARPEQLQEWAVDQQPHLRIAMTGGIDFASVVGLSVLPDGGVVLASDLRNNLQFFDAEGRHVKSVGRRGQGPGEFDGVDDLHRFGDTLALVDMNRAIHRFTLDGKYVASKRVTGATERMHGFFANGDRLVGIQRTERLREGSRQQATEELVRLSASSRVTLGAFSTQEFMLLPGGQLRGSVYSPRNRVAVLGDRFCAGYAGSQTFGCYDGSGRRLWTRSLTGAEPVAATKVDQEAYFNDIYEVNVGSPRSMLDDQVRWARRRVTFASSLGVYGAMHFADDGALWIGPPSTDDWRRTNPNPLPRVSTRWRVFSPSGAAIANVTLPPRFYLLEAGSNYVAGVTKDDDDLEVVLVYRLRKK